MYGASNETSEDDELPFAEATTYGTNPAVSILPGIRGRTFAGLEVREWCFLVLSIANILVTVALTIYRLDLLIQDGETQSADFTFAILILANTIFCAYYVLDGVLREREFEVYALVMAILVILIYCIIEYSINAGGRSDVKLARLIAAVVLAPPNIILAIFVARHFGWLEFRIVGASTLLQHLYREAARYTCLLKFDVQISVCLVVIALHEGTDILLPEIITLSVGLPVSLLWAFCGWIALVKENKMMVGLFSFLGLAEPGYVCYKVYSLYEYILSDDWNKATDEDQLIVYITLGVCAFSLIIRIIVFIELYRVVHNFGKGLKDRAFSNVSQSSGILGDG